MNVSCKDCERIFMDGSAEEWAGLEQHAANCAACAEELRGWKALSAAAEELRDFQEDPALWAKIESSLRKEEQERTVRHGFREKLRFWRGIPLGWQAAFAGALVLVLTLSGAYLALHRPGGEPGRSQLLKNSALVEVERTERDYMQAIDKLAADARPQLDSPATPLMASYKEKLMVLDGAIHELRVEAGRNPSNAHLRYQLLAMYQDKQQTLQEILETKP
jgi:anti-sigma-K factor RskA